MSADGLSDDPNEIVATYTRRREQRSELTTDQTAAMQSLDEGLRAGQVSARDAEEIEALIRKGRVAGARKHLTEARRAGRGNSDLDARLAWLAQHDRDELVDVLVRAVAVDVLKEALGIAEPPMMS